MKRFVASIAVLLVVFFGIYGLADGNASESQTAGENNVQKATRQVSSQQEAIEAIEDLGCSVSKGGTEIRLYGSDVTDEHLKYLKWFPKVKLLAMWESHITDAGLKALEGLASIENLNLVGTKITGTGLYHLRNCKHLKELNLNNATITDAGMKHIAAFKSLETLLLHQTRITSAGLKSLKDLRLLAELNLSETNVADAGLESLTGLTNLKRLFLDDTRVTDAGLKHLKGLRQLECLFLDETDVTDAGMKHLECLRQLKNLGLPKTEVTDAGLKHLEELRQLECLSLDETGVTDAGLKHLEGLSKLDYVYLSRTLVTDVGVDQLKAKLPRLSNVSYRSLRFEWDGWKAGDPIPIDVASYYRSEGPRISVGTFSDRLKSANAKTIINVAADMKKQWTRLPIEAMYVTAIRLYDLGHKDEAVYWFYSAQHRDRLLRAVLAEKEDGAEAWKLCHACFMFNSLTGLWINKYAFSNPEKMAKTMKTVLSEGENNPPEFTVIYPKFRFISKDLWAAKNKKIVGSILGWLDWVQEHADAIKAERKKNDIEGKY